MSGASGELQKPHRHGGVVHAVDYCIVGALGTQQPHLLLYLTILALVFLYLVIWKKLFPVSSFERDYAVKSLSLKGGAGKCHAEQDGRV